MDGLQLLARVPCTACLTVGLWASGVYGRAHLGRLDENIHRQLGHSPKLLWDGGAHRIFTSILFTSGRWHFFLSTLMLVPCLGVLEFRQGSLIAMLVFLGTHVATILLMLGGVLMLKRLTESRRGNLLWYTRDVGPSAGYYGCLGFAMVDLWPDQSMLIATAVIVLLVLRLSWSTGYLIDRGQMMSADISHLIAFPLGCLARLLFCA